MVGEQDNFMKMVFLALFGGLSVSNRFLMVGQGQPLLRYFTPSQKSALAQVLCDESRGRIMYIRSVILTNSDQTVKKCVYF